MYKLCVKHFILSCYILFSIYTFADYRVKTQFKLSNMFIACEAYYEEMKKLA